MTKLNLRQKAQKKYLDAIEHNSPTLTAGPFFSLKTETIQEVISRLKDVVLYDLRNGIDSLPLSPKTKHVFLDSTEIVPLIDLTKLVFSLKEKQITVHLISHLYFYESIQGLIPEAELVFPQLLGKKDLKQMCLIFADFPAAERKIAFDFIDYADGWPVIADLLNKPKRMRLLKKSFETISKNPDKIEPLEIFKALMEPYCDFCFKVLNKAKAVNKKMARQSVPVPDKIWRAYRLREIDLKALATRVHPALWHFVKYGFLWLDQETRTLKVPRPLADFYLNEK